MIRWTNLLIPAFAALAAGLFVGVKFWDEGKQGLLVALSVIAAGVLVRLARGLPFTSTDHYEVDEIRNLTRAVAQIVRSLRLLLLLVLAGMFGLVAAKPIYDAVLQSEALAAWAPPTERILSGLLGLVLAYVVNRMLQVVRGDQDLTELQSTFVVRAVERRQGKRFEDQQARLETPAFKTPEGYGRVIQ